MICSRARSGHNVTSACRHSPASRIGVVCEVCFWKWKGCKYCSYCIVCFSFRIWDMAFLDAFLRKQTKSRKDNVKLFYPQLSNWFFSNVPTSCSTGTSSFPERRNAPYKLIQTLRILQPFLFLNCYTKIQKEFYFYSLDQLWQQFYDHY